MHTYISLEVGQEGSSHLSLWCNCKSAFSALSQLFDLAQKLPEKKQVISSQSLPAFKKHNLNKMCFCAVIKGFCVQVKLLIPFKKDWRDSHAPLFDSTISCAFLPLCRFMGRKFCPSLHFMPRWLCQNVVRKQDSRPRSERVILSTVFKRKQTTHRLRVKTNYENTAGTPNFTDGDGQKDNPMDNQKLSRLRHEKQVSIKQRKCTLYALVCENEILTEETVRSSNFPRVDNNTKFASHKLPRSHSRRDANYPDN